MEDRNSALDPRSYQTNGFGQSYNGMDMNINFLANPTIFQGSQSNENINYYQEACKLYIANVVLTTQMKELVNEKNELLAKLARLESNSNSGVASRESYQMEDKKKRHRRGAKDIDRLYTCPIDLCQKSYGSEGSLSQHIKIKHPEYLENLNNMQTLKSNSSKKNPTNDQSDAGSVSKAPQSHTEKNDEESESADK